MKLSENLRSWANALRKCKTDEIVDKLRDGAVFDGFADKTADFVSRAEHATIIKALAGRVAKLEAELESVKASDKEAWYWVDKTCELLECGAEGVFAIKDRIKALRDEIVEEVSVASSDES